MVKSSLVGKSIAALLDSNTPSWKVPIYLRLIWREFVFRSEVKYLIFYWSYFEKCHFCEQIFSTATANFTHMKLKHNIRKSFNDIHNLTEEKCNFCGEILKCPRDFIEHIAKIHPNEEAPEERLKNFKNGIGLLYIWNLMIKLSYGLSPT